MNSKTSSIIIDKSTGAPALVSIIIPCYNHENFIERTLNSVIEDTYEHKEIIIINDGSTDNSDVKIQEWIAALKQKESIRYINRPNKGICATINEMLELARGKYILPLASDDCLFGDTITRRVKILEERPDKYVLLNDAYVIDDAASVLLVMPPGDDLLPFVKTKLGIKDPAPATTKPAGN